MIKKIIAVFLTFACASAAAAPAAEPWPLWEKHDAAGDAQVSHEIWGDFLARHVVEENGIALVRYGEVSAADKKNLDEYLAALSQAPVASLNREEQLAFWINLYNALTVQTILENYPVSSIKKISSGFLPTGPWDDKLAEVAGEALSLNDIEHRILRPIWKDPRLHYAVNCASVGCPNLAATAYTAANAEEMLAAAAAEYVNHPRGANVQNGKLYVSSIYDWFAEDFGGEDAAIIAHLQKYAAPDLREKLDAVSKISGDDYDWSLNDKK
ncbi:MAG: DUF547 domain-containing protein [Gammaproteobacteria bacterium]